MLLPVLNVLLENTVSFRVEQHVLTVFLRHLVIRVLEGASPARLAQVVPTSLLYVTSHATLSVPHVPLENSQ